MKFKEFIQISEEQSGTDKGLMGYFQSYYADTPNNNGGRRKPSNGQPFPTKLTTNAGSNPRGGAAGGGAPASAPQMMRKKMRKN
jgi:hypothetical protein